MAKAQESLPVNVLKKLDAVCDRFETDWKAGKKSAIEKHLGSTAGKEREELLRLQLQLELELQTGQGKQSSKDSYLARFPDQSAVVDSVFREFRTEPATQPPASADTSQSQDSARSHKSSEPTIEMPKKIGRFEILALLGQGGCGKVFKARDPDLDRLVAIKVPLQGVLEKEEDIQRFLREARAAATLHHPNVCPVHEVGQDQGAYYIVMAYVEGKSLSEHLEERKELEDQRAKIIVKEMLVKPGEWFTQEVIAQGNHIIIKVNGKTTVDFIDQKNLYPKGHLALQQHDDRTVVEFERIEVKELSSQVEAGFVPLFNGKDLTGWKGVDTDWQSAWHVDPQDQALVSNDHRPGCFNFLWRERQFADFDLRLDFKLVHRGKSGGVLIRGIPTEPDWGWLKINVCDDANLPKPGSNLTFVRARNVQARPGARLKALGEWNALEIQAHGPRIRVVVNGSEAAQYDTTRIDWTWAVSKELATANLKRPAGAIGLAPGYKGTEVRFRNIRIKEAGPAAGKVGVDPGDCPDRQVAEWVLKRGGWVAVAVGDQEQPKALKLSELPNAPFRLRKVWLAGARLSDADLVGLHGLTDLRTIHLENTGVSDAGIRHLKGCRRLEVVALGASGISDDGLAIVKEWPNLHTLYLRETSVTDKGLHHLAGLTKLDNVGLDFTGVTGPGPVHLRDLPSFQGLGLAGSKVTNATLEHVRELKNLRALRLQEADITDAGLARLAGLPRLYELNLWGSPITDAAVPYLGKMKNLGVINLERINVTPDGYRQLRKALPKCIIVPGPPA